MGRVVSPSFVHRKAKPCCVKQFPGPSAHCGPSAIFINFSSTMLHCCHALSKAVYSEMLFAKHDGKHLFQLRR